MSAGEPPRIKLEQAREAEEQSCSGSGEVTGENSRRRPRTAALQHDDGPLSAEDARARAHKQQRHESVEEARRGKAVEDVLSGSGCESMYTVNGEAEKPVLVKADSASEAEEALGAAAALMELFSRGLVDDPKKPAAKSGASHRRDPNGKQNKYCHFCQQIKVVFSPPPLPVGDADGKHNKYCHFCHNIIKVVYSPPPTLAPAAAPLPLVLPLICLVRRARAGGGDAAMTATVVMRRWRKPRRSGLPAARAAQARRSREGRLLPLPRLLLPILLLEVANSRALVGAARCARRIGLFRSAPS